MPKLPFAQRLSPHLSPLARSALLMLVSSALFAFMSALIRVSAEEMHPFQIVFFRTAFGLAFMLPWLSQHLFEAFKRGRRTAYLTRSFFSLAAMLLSFYATAYIPIADATALSFAAPLFATAGAALFLGETVRLRRWSATIVGFIGVLIIVRPSASSLQPVALAALAGAAFTAGALLTVKSLAATEPAEMIVANMAIYLLPLTLIPALFVWQWPSWTILGWMLLLGGVGTLAQILLTKGLASMQASLAISFDYARLPFAALIAFFWFEETPTYQTWIGAGIVALSTAYIIHREAVLTRQTKQPPAEINESRD